MSDSIPQPSPRSINSVGKYADFGVCVLLVMFVFLIFIRTFWFGFVNYDDDRYVYKNPQVIDGLTFHGIGWAFTYGEIGHWHPLTWVSHMLDAQLFGAGPAGPHLINVILHAANTVLLFLLLRQMSGILWPSAFVAAVFAIHPLRVESVAWVAERKDVLSGLFFMLTLGAYVCYSRGPFLLGRYLAAVVLFACGLLSKSMLVTLPFVLLLLDYWPLQRISSAQAIGDIPSLPDIRHSTWSRLLLEKIPFFLLSAGSCLATSIVSEKVPAIDRFPLSFRIENALVSYVGYMSQMVYPAGLAVPYPFHALPLWKVAGALLLLVAISVVVFAFRRNHLYLIVGWLWYLGMLVPVSGIVQIAYYAHADRYTYLPQIGLYLIVVWAAKDLTLFGNRRRQVLGVAAAGIIGALMVCAWKQTSFWRDGESLWKHALACTSGNYTAENNLGYVLAAQGQTIEAIECYKKALEIYPDYPEANNNLGMIYLDEGRLNEAITNFQRAIEIKPDFAEAHNNLGILLASQGEIAEAIEHYQIAIKINPDFAETYNNLGILFASQGRFDEAIKHYQKALELDPNYVDAHNNFGILLTRQGRFAEAMEQFQTGLELRGNSAEAHNDLGLLLVSLDQVNEAIKYYQKALELKPDYAEAHCNLGTALIQLGNVQEAIGQWEQALRIEPDYAVAHDNLGIALADQGRYAEAMEYFQKTLELANDQGNSSLANAVRAQIRLYETNSSPLPKP
jgi:protein O-mannosyl-transferase